MRWGNSGLRSGHALIRIKQLEKGKVITLPVKIALWYQN